MTLTAELAATGDLGRGDPFASAGTIRIAQAGAQVSEVPSANNGGHEDDRKPPSEQRQRERDRTEGNVIEVDCAADASGVTIANRDGRVVVMLPGEARSACGSIRTGQYFEADGVKIHEGLFEAESVHGTR